MSEEFSIEIVNPDKSFISKDNVTEVVVPAYEGDMGILKDHISIISFLKPGIIKVLSKNEEEKYYIEDGILEFKDNNLSILTSFVSNLKDLDSSFIEETIKNAEKDLLDDNMVDQKKFLITQKIDALKSINSN